MRLKYHLARLHGHDVGLCIVSSLELIQKALEAIDEKDRKKEDAERKKVERASRSFGISSSDFEAKGSERGSTASLATASANVVGSGRSSFFVPRTGHGSQPSIKSVEDMPKDLPACSTSFLSVFFINCFKSFLYNSTLEIVQSPTSCPGSLARWYFNRVTLPVILVPHNLHDRYARFVPPSSSPYSQNGSKAFSIFEYCSELIQT